MSEEVWSWWRDGSVHRADGRVADMRAELHDPAGADPLVYDVAADGPRRGAQGEVDREGVARDARRPACA